MIPSRDPISHFVSAQDGLKLHVQDYGAANDAMPVVCLPGLSRPADDFDRLARSLSFNAAKPRRVVAIDYRGRAGSEYDKKWENYSLAVENDDILTVLAALGIARAIFVGTSRGGLHSMVLSATRPTVLHAVVLNDIGPIVEPLGLVRIKTALGTLPPPPTIAQGADMLKRVMGERFPALSEQNWLDYAALTFATENGKLARRCDPNLVRTLEGITSDMQPIDVWPQFLGLADIPVLVLRGEHSDILSEQTYAAMQSRHPACTGHIVQGQGHAPLILDQPTIDVVQDFVSQHG